MGQGPFPGHVSLCPSQTVPFGIGIINVVPLFGGLQTYVQFPKSTDPRFTAELGGLVVSAVGVLELTVTVVSFIFFSQASMNCDSNDSFF